MTTTQDVSREAGRELDALVAERVMGWTHGHDGLNERWLRDGQNFHYVNRVAHGWMPPDGREWSYHPTVDSFAPSWEIVDAWGVVACMGARGWPLYQVGALVSFGDSPNAAYAQFAQGWLPDWHRAEAPTVALAICLAALKAVGA